jgi:hypothetical protein
VDLDKGKGFKCIMISMYLVQVALGVHCLIALNLQFLVRQWGFKATSFFYFGAYCQRGEIKVKATRSTTIYKFQKLLSFELVFFDQNPINTKRSPLVTKLLSCGGEIFLTRKWEAFGFWSKLVWKMSWFAKLKCFNLEVRKVISFCENKPSGGKMIQICQIPYLFIGF